MDDLSAHTVLSSAICAVVAKIISEIANIKRGWTIVPPNRSLIRDSATGLPRYQRVLSWANHYYNDNTRAVRKGSSFFSG